MAASRDHIPRKFKALGETQSAFIVNSDFSYFNSQVSDKDAFRHFVGAPAGEETQLELQEPSQPIVALADGGLESGRSLADTKPAIVKIEKENLLSAIPAMPAVLGRLKQALVEAETEVVKTESDSAPILGESPDLRISQLENEVAHLRQQICANQEASEVFIRGLKHEWMVSRGCFLTSRTESVAYVFAWIKSKVILTKWLSIYRTIMAGDLKLD
ncbi:hypothetical protein B0H19DRAFT_1248729 [Mycena capillaripes]|nr:hypothetical protein B0H19DRAFT_1248729 [Mycena capillaripes]